MFVQSLIVYKIKQTVYILFYATCQRIYTRHNDKSPNFVEIKPALGWKKDDQGQIFSLEKQTFCIAFLYKNIQVTWKVSKMMLCAKHYCKNKYMYTTGVISQMLIQSLSFSFNVENTVLQ